MRWMVPSNATTGAGGFAASGACNSRHRSGGYCSCIANVGDAMCSNACSDCGQCCKEECVASDAHQQVMRDSR